jgi:hypothetical protein
LRAVRSTYRRGERCDPGRTRDGDICRLLRGRCSTTVVEFKESAARGAGRVFHHTLCTYGAYACGASLDQQADRTHENLGKGRYGTIAAVQTGARKVVPNHGVTISRSEYVACKRPFARPVNLGGAPLGRLRSTARPGKLPPCFPRSSTEADYQRVRHRWLRGLDLAETDTCSRRTFDPFPRAIAPESLSVARKLP